MPTPKKLNMNPDARTARTCGLDNNVKITLFGGVSALEVVIAGSVDAVRSCGVGISGMDVAEGAGLGTRVDAEVEGEVDP